VIFKTDEPPCNGEELDGLTSTVVAIWAGALALGIFLLWGVVVLSLIEITTLTQGIPRDHLLRPTA